MTSLYVDIPKAKWICVTCKNRHDTKRESQRCCLAKRGYDRIGEVMNKIK